MKWLNIFKGKQKATHHVFDVGDHDFDLQVVQRSYKTPLLVDFWAAWCMPCRQLTPVLERIAMEPDSPVWLAKLDTAANPQTAQRFNIQSIPNVLLIRDAAIIGGFVGLQFESTIREYIAEKLAEPRPQQPQLEPHKALKQAVRLLKKGDGFGAALLLRRLPDDQRALSLLPLAEFLWDVDDGDAFTGLEMLDNQYRAAAAAMRAGHPDKAEHALQQALTHGEPIDQSYAQELLAALNALVSNA